MTYLEKLAAAILTEAGRINDPSVQDDLARSLAPMFAKRYARAVLTAMRDCPIPVRHLTTFEFAEREWPKLIDAILSEPLSEG